MINELGLIHIYCGQGKGKTTASLGLAIRAAGRGYKVLILQFLKGMITGELETLKNIPNITVMRGKPLPLLTCKMDDMQRKEATCYHNEALEHAIKMCRDNNIDMLILDEAVGCFDKNMLDRKLLIDFLDTKPEKLEVVLTGRNPHQELLERADYISEIQKIKHPYDKGVKARIGVER